MKTLSLATVGLMIFTSVGLAAPGGGGTGMATAGTAGAVGGGRAGSVAAPAAHVSSGSVGMVHASSFGAGGGFRSGNVGASGLRSSFGGVGSAGLVNRSPGILASPGAAVRVLPTMPTVHNAWSDPVNPRVTGTSAAATRGAATRDIHTGQTLYPGAYGYSAANRPASGQFHHGHDGYGRVRGYHRYYYNNFPYAVYYPYLYGGPGYDGLAGDYVGLNTDSSASDLGAPDFTTTPNDYYGQVAPAQNPSNSDQSTATANPQPQQPLPPDAPAVGPQSPSTNTQSPGSSAQQGPDSLVEAVQDELAKRGYFAGKPDAVYSDATKEAIRRFQTDQGLPATGRINEATLHALRLD